MIPATITMCHVLTDWLFCSRGDLRLSSFFVFLFVFNNRPDPKWKPVTFWGENMVRLPFSRCSWAQLIDIFSINMAWYSYVWANMCDYILGGRRISSAKSWRLIFLGKRLFRSWLSLLLRKRDTEKLEIILKRGLYGASAATKFLFNCFSWPDVTENDSPDSLPSLVGEERNDNLVWYFSERIMSDPTFREQRQLWDKMRRCCCSSSRHHHPIPCHFVLFYLILRRSGHRDDGWNPSHVCHDDHEEGGSRCAGNDGPALY